MDQKLKASQARRAEISVQGWLEEGGEKQCQIPGMGGGGTRGVGMAAAKSVGIASQLILNGTSRGYDLG